MSHKIKTGRVGICIDIRQQFTVLVCESPSNAFFSGTPSDIGNILHYIRTDNRDKELTKKSSCLHLSLGEDRHLTQLLHSCTD